MPSAVGSAVATSSARTTQEWDDHYTRTAYRARLARVLPASWFPTGAAPAPVLDAVLDGTAVVAQAAHAVLDSVYALMRLSTAYSWFVDTWAADFFGTRLRRMGGADSQEPFFNYIPRIKAALFPLQGTIAGLRGAVHRALGWDTVEATGAIIEAGVPRPVAEGLVHVIELRNPWHTGAYGSLSPGFVNRSLCAYNTRVDGLGGAHWVTGATGTAAVNSTRGVYGTLSLGTDVLLNAKYETNFGPSGATSDEIKRGLYAEIDRNRPVGTRVWLRLWE